ncbi:MAG TPA: tetratricopeptide repeat protein [Thermodesulfovibrionales bacterium]|jgi:tetratricopeptide (TPR) repeat protein|nr:tetratricopeptide repeat protein [Thermodesulfovibrionales bacterium]
MKKIKKFRKAAKKPFIIALNEEIDRKVDEALMMVERGLIDKGASTIKELMVNHSDYHSVQFAMGVVQGFRKQYDEAIKCFIKAVEIFPYFLDAQFNLAVSYQKKLDVGNCIRAYQRVIEIGSPEDALVRQSRDFLSDMDEQIRKDHGIRLDAYLKGMDIFRMACDYMESEKWEEAIACFKDCLNIVRRHYQSYGNMGLCYAKLGKKEQAIAALDRALEINPRYEPAIVNREMISGLKEGEEIPDGPIETLDYSKDYEAKKKSFIAKIIDSLKKK